MSKHIDGLTGRVFDTEEEYLAHVSPVTGFKPTDLEHHGQRGILVAKKALERTGSLNTEVETELNSKMSDEGLANAEHGLAEVRAGRGPKA